MGISFDSVDVREERNWETSLNDAEQRQKEMLQKGQPLTGISERIFNNLPPSIAPDFHRVASVIRDKSSSVSFEKFIKNPTLFRPIILDLKTRAMNLKDHQRQAQALLAVVLIEACHSVKDAKATARLIKDSSLQDQAFLAIAKIEARHNVKDAKATAKLIQHPHQKALALIAIAKIEIQHNVETAKATALLIQDTVQDQALCKILTRLKGQTIFEVVQIEAKQSIETAKATALFIQDPDWKDLALFTIVKIEAKQSLEAAKATALLIQDLNWKAAAFSEIAHIENPHIAKDTTAHEQALTQSLSELKAKIETMKRERVIQG